MLLERILKNTVSILDSCCLLFYVDFPQSKCTEMILELNHCLEVCVCDTCSFTTSSNPIYLPALKEILRANASVKTVADLATKYRKNVQYNLEVTKGN